MLAEEVGEENVCTYPFPYPTHRSLTLYLHLPKPAVFFGHLTPAVEDLRYQHMYHPVPLEQKSPRLARVINEIAAGLFGDDGVYEPLLNTIRNHDYYLLSEDFDSCAFLISCGVLGDVDVD